MFAVITPALMTGAFADRVMFKPYLLFIFLWIHLVYYPFCHWIWGGGWMFDEGVWDFAGGIVVHCTAGFGALAVVMALPHRKKLEPELDTDPHNIPFVALGTALLWFGWFSFNGGSSLASGALASSTLMTTHTAGSYADLRLEPEISRGRRAAYLVLSRLRPPCRRSAGGAVWVLLDWAHTGRPTFVGVINGGIAGLAGVTPASGFVSVGAGGVIVC